MNGRTRILGTLAGSAVDAAPVWLMRQAGRYLPEYRAIRAEHPFLDLVRNPALCTEVALQPLRRFDLDASIVFSDILLIPDAMGAGLQFVQGDGPSFLRPVDTPAGVAELETAGLRERLDFVYTAVAQLRAAAPEPALFGFAGSPWTLLCYLVQGSASADFARAKTFLYRYPDAAISLLDRLTDAIIGHLSLQVEAGADVVQVFDTWGGLLGPSQWAEHTARGLRRIAETHARSMQLLARDTKDFATQEQADMLSALLLATRP